MDAQVTKDNTWLSAIDGLSMAYYAIASVVIAIFIKALVNTFGNLDFCRVDSHTSFITINYSFVLLIVIM